MSTPAQESSHGHSTSASTEASQASTKVPASQASASKFHDGAVTGLDKPLEGDIIPQSHLVFRGTSNRKDFVKDDSEIEKYDVDDLAYSQPGPAWTETTDVPQEHLGFIQVSSFMINQMIGTGIFTSPGYILLLTRSKPISLAMWIAGGIYQLLSAFVFLEFSTALPYNGGALIYLDEAFPQPRMLAATIFSAFWIGFCSNTGNCVTAAVYILLLVYPDLYYNEVDDRSVRFLGIVINSLACLILYFSLRGSLLLNSVFAALKVAMLFTFFVAGIAHARKSGSGLADFNHLHSGSNAIDSIAAMTWIIGTYEGWENTNYIAGEIRASKKTLKMAAFTTISLVTVLYVLVTTAYLAVLLYAEIASSQADISVQFADAVFGGTGMGTKVAITLSAFSNLVAATYTVAKVKQAIAWQRIIPFYKFFGRQDPQFNTPGGALVLHWVVTTIHIAAVSTNTDAWNFELGIFTYGYEILLVFLGIGIFFLPRRMKIVDPNWKPMYMKTQFARIMLVSIFVGMTIVILYSTTKPRDSGTTPRFWWPIVLGAVVAGGALYWAALKALQMTWGTEDTLGRRLGFEVTVHETGDKDIPNDLAAMMKDALKDGSRRRLTYKVSGNLARLVDGSKSLWALITRYLG